ncbi:hypothetical protein RR46_04490 [Papilio xuthus]|uniref:Uncharacterized protein n=1 Tax=Papilio xuthus TaxID=66420 RepID=A0A194PM69_PAPXU|nr:hypothetical protein RR46_04490 [Papilio xuthus]
MNGEVRMCVCAGPLVVFRYFAVISLKPGPGGDTPEPRPYTAHEERACPACCNEANTYRK